MSKRSNLFELVSKFNNGLYEKASFRKIVDEICEILKAADVLDAIIGKPRERGENVILIISLLQKFRIMPPGHVLSEFEHMVEKLESKPDKEDPIPAFTSITKGVSRNN